MSDLAQLRNKIRSIQTTKKITHAVRVVSMSQYNKIDKAGAPLRTYAHRLKYIFASLVHATPHWQHPLFSLSHEKYSRTLYILIGSAKGLCGSLNSNLFRSFDEYLENKGCESASFITIGHKVTQYVKSKGITTIVASYPELGSSNIAPLADDLINKITQQVPHYSSVHVFSNEAKSFFIQRPIVTSLLPLQLDDQATSEKANNIASHQTALLSSMQEDVIWEQDLPTVLSFLAQQYLKSSMMQLLFFALRAEHAARFLAMENSTNNAEKYLERLTLQFNKLRQALITKEVSELTAGLQRRA